MKNKLLFIIHSLKRGGGAERIVANLTFQLSKNYNISILTFHDFKNLYHYNGNYFSLKENLGFVRKILNSLKFYTIIRPFRIYKVIRKISPDIILSNMDFTNIYAILSKAIFRYKIPLIICVHTNPKIAYRKGETYINIFIKNFYKLKLVDKIITVSKEIQKIFEYEYGIDKRKIRTIYNSIDLERINSLKREKLFESEELFNSKKIIKFITIGRLREVKGYKNLIDAFSLVKEQVPNSKLIIIGEGPLKGELEKKIKELALSDDVLLLGLKRNPMKYLIKSDIFVLSSLREGFPVALLEALACGLPIISTDCETGPREILDNGRYGLLVKVMDEVNLAKNMILLANDKNLRNKFSQLSLKRVKIFNSDDITDIWISMVEKELK